MYRLQPEEEMLMKKGGKIKQKQKQKQSVNIKNIITIDRKTPTRKKTKSAPKRQPQQTPPQTKYLGTGVQYPFINLLRPQSNDTRGVTLTGATATEANNNIMATIRKSQEITEGKLNARIDDMTSTIAKDLKLGIYQFLASRYKGKPPPDQEEGKPKTEEPKTGEQKEEEQGRIDVTERYLARKAAREARQTEPGLGLPFGTGMD